MASYIIRRIGIMFISLFLISIITFIIIQLPTGDYATLYLQQMERNGENVDQATIDNIKLRYGAEVPLYDKYVNWVKGIVTQGYFGESFQWNRPVMDVIWEKLPYSLMITIFGIFITYLISIPLAIYSAVKQYSPGDQIIGAFSFLGMATPAFLLILFLMYVLLKYFGIPAGGLFSQQYMEASWSLAKVGDMLKHLILPAIVIGITSTGWTIRTLRATVLDELGKDYVETARLKGMSEARLIMKYPVRIALNPILSTIGYILPMALGGEVIISIVANIPTLGPLLVGSLMSQDMYMAGTIVLIGSFLTVIGTLISDLILAWSDPRIKFE